MRFNIANLDGQPVKEAGEKKVRQSQRGRVQSMSSGNGRTTFPLLSSQSIDLTEVIEPFARPGNTNRFTRIVLNSYTSGPQWATL